MVEVGGERVSLLEAGVGPLVVLLHALGRDADDWVEVIEALATRYRCVAVDLAGHGDARRVPPFSFESMVADLERVLAWLDEPYALVTHSMGATVGWLHAMRGPERLTALVAEDTVPPRSGYDIPEPSPEPPEPVPYAWEARSTIIRQLNRPDPGWWPGLARVDVPCLLLSGREDDAELCDAAGLVPDCELVEVPVGHWIHQDAPDRFVTLVLAFLDERLR